MQEGVSKGYIRARNIIIFLDTLIAIIIILAAQEILQTPLGKAAAIFGFIMILATTALKLIDKI